MQISRDALEIFPYVTSTMSISDIRLWMISMFGDGVVEGLEPKVTEGRVTISAGTAIVDGVIIHITQPIIMPYSQWVDQDVMLVYAFDAKRPTLPEVTADYNGEKAYIILYSIVGGNISLAKRKYSLASKNPKALGFVEPASKYNDLVTGKIADRHHVHVGIYRLAVEKGEASDNSILTIPPNAISVNLSIKSIDIPSGGARLHCYLTSDNRVRVYAERNGSIVARGVAEYTIIKAEYGKSGDPYAFYK